MARMGQQLLLCIARKELGNSFPPLCGVTSHKNNLGGDRDCNCFKPSSYSCIIGWFRAVIGRTKTAGHSLAILIIWSGWKERNKRIFRWQEISIQALVGGIQDEVRNWCSAGDKLLRPLIVKPISE